MGPYLVYVYRVFRLYHAGCKFVKIISYFCMYFCVENVLKMWYS